MIFYDFIGNQSLLEQILVDNIQQEQTIPNAGNWFEITIKSVDNLFSLLYNFKKVKTNISFEII